MRVVVVGAGLMGAQIAVEYAAHGHEVIAVSPRPDRARERIDAARIVAERAGLAVAATSRLTVLAALDEVAGEADLVVESVPEDFDAKVPVLAAAARRWPGAMLASNTSSLSISALGETAGAATRMIGTHYWNPPILMPLVEVIRGEATGEQTVEAMVTLLRSIGKRPVVIERDVPGFVWNRLQLALVREAAWIVEQGVATPETVDEIVRDGLARRWRLTGPFATMALGGADTFRRIAANLFPVLSDAEELGDLGPWLEADPATLGAVRERRDEGLLEERARDLAHGPSDWGDVQGTGAERKREGGGR